MAAADFVFAGLGGKTPEELAENGLKAVEKGYTVLRICPHDTPYGRAWSFF